MKKSMLVLALCGIFLSGCLPAFLQPDSGSSSPAPISDSDLEATAAILSELTLQALPTPTLAPSETPVISTATETISAAMAPATVNNTLETVGLTSITAIATNTQIPSGSSTMTSATFTQNPGQSPTFTETLHPRFYGTLPPNLPSGRIILVNKSKREVYISLQCTTPDGYFTVLEYPVPRLVETRGPAGKYFYVAWVGGKKLTGRFNLGTQDEVTITINKDAISIK